MSTDLSPEFTEAFEDVLHREASRKPVWIVGLKSMPIGGGFNGMVWSAIRGIRQREFPGGSVGVFVPGGGGNRFWVKWPDEIFENEYEAEAAAFEKCRKQAEAAKDLFKPMPPMAEPSPDTSPSFYMDFKYGTK